MLEKGGCEDVTIDYKTKTATVKVPAAVTDEMLSKSMSGQYSATVKQ